MPVSSTDFVSTLGLTDVFESAVIVPESGAIYRNGVYQGYLYDFLSSYITNFNAMNTKLDDDAGVALEYATKCNLSAIGEGGYYIEKNGMSTPRLATLLYAIDLKFRQCTGILDSDGGVTDTDYTSTLSLGLDTVKCETTNSMCIHDQGYVVDYLNTVVTNFNLLLAKLDADA